MESVSMQRHATYTAAAVANTPFPVYAPLPHRTNMTVHVYNMPKIPTNEKGANLDKVRNKHSGSRTMLVNPTRVHPFGSATPNKDCANAGTLSFKIML